MYREKSKKIWLLLLGVLLTTVFLGGCGDAARQTSGTGVMQESGTEQSAELAQLTAGETSLSDEELAEYAMDVSLTYDAEQRQLRYTMQMPLIPSSDDAYLYLFAADNWEEDADVLSGEPVTRGRKGRTWETKFPFRDVYLFQRFIPALRVDGGYVQVGKSVYLSNPEALAENQDGYPEIDSKKGILLDPTMVGTPELTDLGAKHAIYNIPLSNIMGETTDQTFPTITYTYRGRNYVFNGAAINGYDGLFTYLTDMGMSVTAVVLNDWNEAYP